MAKGRLISIPQTRGTFQIRGIVNGTERQGFYSDKKTKSGKDFRRVNFGCEYNEKQSIYIDLNGMVRDKVYFSKRGDDGKTVVKDVPWTNRNKFKEDGYRLIGVNLGIEKTTDKDGKLVNLRKTMPEFDACEYISDTLQDDTSMFIKGNIDISSYTSQTGELRRSIKYVPSQISLCKDDIDFSTYDDDHKPIHDFKQQIVFMGIDKEMEDGKATGRFVVSAKIVNYNDIVDAEFYVADNKLANMFRKYLKPYNAINVWGHMEVVHVVQEQDEDDWGEVDPMAIVTAPSHTDLVITGASGSSIDKETYTEDNISEAIASIMASKTAEENFNGKKKTESDVPWGEEESDDAEEDW